MQSLIRRPMVRNATGFLVLLALIVLGQWLGGAYHAEFAEDPDESAHYVTGLMVRDYVGAGFPWPPMEFAERFHAQYPRVALGHWPPFFYGIESVWMLLFGEGRTSILVLIAAIAAGWALLCRNLFGRFWGRCECWLAALFLIAMPDVLRASRMVMAEILVALLTLAALWMLHKLVDEPCGRWSVLFGVLASAAVLTKATGVLLAPLPILSVITLRRWSLVRSPWFWLPAVMVIVVCGPWYAFAPYALHEKMVRFGGTGLRGSRIIDFFVYLATQISWAGLAIALAGWWITASRVARREEKSSFWILALWTIPVACAFRLTIGAWHTKHLVTIAPLLLLFAGVGLHRVLDRLGRSRLVVGWLIAACIFVVMGQHFAGMGKKQERGMGRVAEEILRRPEFAGKPLLVVSDAAGEGAFVAEIAMREKRPGHVVQRGYKALTIYTRMGRWVRARFQGPEEMMHYFLDSPDVALVFDPTSRREIHGRMTSQMLEAYPEHWREAFAQPRLDQSPGPGAEPIRIFLRKSGRWP